ncbi:hypothetical protein AVEN_1916-1 [Araneus ventricosus]|uniref:F-box domain-containing protein n=1 Tax=Araneus ventricosus TaxID=182803 RepID=A0A4Y2KS31_ARAVE|nr:hypothetical protein AVEN_1916-1 [Araneus ventricosus]
MYSCDENNKHFRSDDYIDVNENISTSQEKHHTSGKLADTGSDTYEQVIFNSIIKHDSSKEKKIATDSEIDWANLPSVAIENIFSFLPRLDQTNMSVVCSKWSKEFSSPGVWKKLQFYLPRRDYIGKTFPEIKFGKRYASMLRHVDIIVKSVKIEETDEIWKQLKLFINILTYESQLTTIKFINLNNYLYRLSHEDKEYLLQVILHFFTTQKNLKSIVFVKCKFEQDYACKLLKAIFYSDNHTIKNLTLRGFINEDIFRLLSHENKLILTQVCHRMAKVNSIEVEYTQIFEEFINCIYEKIICSEYQLHQMKSGMSNLNIYCDGKRHFEFRGIPPNIWTLLRRVFRELKVEVNIKIRNSPENEIPKFLAESMPLNSLNFEFKKMFTSSRVKINAVFSHISNMNLSENIENLRIIYKAPISSFSETVVPFIQSCRNVKEIDMYVSYCPSELENSFKKILENHPPRLNKITVSFDYFQRNQSVEKISGIIGEYYALLKQSGIDWKLFYRSQYIPKTLEKI